MLRCHILLLDFDWYVLPSFMMSFGLSLFCQILKWLYQIVSYAVLFGIFLLWNYDNWYWGVSMSSVVNSWYCGGVVVIASVSPFLISCLFWDYLFLVLSWVWLTSLGWSFLPTTLCSAEFVNRCCLNLFVSWNALFSLSIVIENFSVYGFLSWCLWALRVCRTSAQALIAFIVSVEKAGVHRLIGLLSDTTWLFLLEAF